MTKYIRITNPYGAKARRWHKNNEILKVIGWRDGSPYVGDSKGHTMTLSASNWEFVNMLREESVEL